MEIKNLLIVPLVMLSFFSVCAQDRIFNYSNIQIRNAARQWGKQEPVGQQSVIFSPEMIKLKIDKNYELTILSHTNLPSNGVIYLCQDEKSNPITVMLISDLKMYVYNKTKRFLINFDKSKKEKTAVIATL